MNLQLTGTITAILDEETGTSKAGKEWIKQSFVINTGDEYNPEVCFSCFGEKQKLLKNFNVNDVVEVSFNLSSREFNGKYYHNIDAWRITALEAQIQEEVDADSELNDDLPF